MQRPDEVVQGTTRAEPEVDAVMSASRALVAVAARSLVDVEDEVTLAQYRALVVLASRGRLRPVDLAESLAVSPSTATRMCDRLVRKELIERSHREADRREVELSLTAAGRALVRKVTGRRRRDYRRIVARIPAGQRQRLVDAFRAFTDAAGEVPEDSWSL